MYYKKINRIRSPQLTRKTLETDKCPWDILYNTLLRGSRFFTVPVPSSITQTRDVYDVASENNYVSTAKQSHRETLL